MTREELREHCEKQIEMCESWAIGKGEKPSGKIYEEHKLILELLEQDNALNKIRTDIDGIEINGLVDEHTMFVRSAEQVKQMALNIIDKYMKEVREEREVSNGNNSR